MIDNQPPNNLREKAVKGVAWSAAQRWGNQAISFVVFFVLARLLQPEAFGLVAMAAVFTAFIQIFLDQGLSQAIVQRPNLEPDHLDTAFWFGILTGGLMTVIGISLSGQVAEIYDEPDLQPVVAWMSLTFLLTALSSTQMAILQRDLNFKALATRTLLASLCGGITGVSAAWMGYGVWSLVAKELVNAIVGVLTLWRISRWRPSFHISLHYFKDLFSFGINLVGIKIVGFFNQRSDDFLIGYFLGTASLGYYSMAYRLMSLVNGLMTGIAEQVAFSAFSRLQLQPDRLRQAFYQVTHFGILLAFPAFVGLVVLAPELITVLFSNQWLPSIPILQILALAGLVMAAMNANGYLLYAIGKPGWFLALMSLITLTNVTGFIVIANWGLVAIAAVFATTQYVYAPLYLWIVHRNFPLNSDYFKLYTAPLSGAVAMGLIVEGLKIILQNEFNIYAQLVIYSLAGGISYVIIIALCDLSTLRQLFHLGQLAWRKQTTEIIEPLQ